MRDNPPQPGSRIVVGTMYSGEHEFEECRAAVNRQTVEPVDHFVVGHLPKREAHARLHREFAARAARCDIFIKLDADMVIVRDDLFEKIAGKFASDPELDHLKIAVSDFFSDRLIGALNCYRSGSRWDEIPDVFHTDAAPANRRKVVGDWTDLAPAAWHCKDPSGFQAFHFGLHKGLKVREAARVKRVSLVHKHWTNIELTWKHFTRTADSRLLLASLGAELALAGTLGTDEIDYDSDRSRQVYDTYEALSAPSLRRRVRWMRLWNRRGLPVSLRGKQIALGWAALVGEA